MEAIYYTFDDFTLLTYRGRLRNAILLWANGEIASQRMPRWEAAWLLQGARRRQAIRSRIETEMPPTRVVAGPSMPI